MCCRSSSAQVHALGTQVDGSYRDERADLASFTTASLQPGVSLSMLLWRHAIAVSELKPGQSCGMSPLQASAATLSAASQSDDCGVEDGV